MTVKASFGPRFESRGHRYGQFLVHFPWLVFLLSLAVVAALGYGMRFLGFSTDFRVNFGPDNPQLQAFDELQNVYNKSDYTLWAVAPKSGQPDAVFDAHVLEAVRTLTHEAWKLPYAIRVDSIANYQHTQADGDDLMVGPLLPDDIEVTPQIARKVRKVTLHEPLLARRLISQTGHVTAVTVTTEFPQVSAEELPSHVTAARELRDHILAQYPELDIYMAGTNMLSNALSEASIADTKTLIPAMYLAIIAITWMMLRSVSATISTMLVIIFSSVTALGLAGYLNILLTPPSMTSPQIITTLAVANSVHLCMTMFAFMHEGHSKLEALTKSVAKNFAPTFLTSVTTVVGFLSINFTDSPPLRDLGNITAIGVMMAWFLSMFLLPALMALLPVVIPPKERSHPLDRGMTWLGESVLTYRKPILWSVALGAIVLSACAFLNETNDEFVHYFDTRIKYRNDADFVVENLTGIYSMEFSLKSGRTGGVSDPEYLKQVEAFADWWKAGVYADKVLYVGSIVQVFTRLNKNMHGDDPAWHRLPEDTQLAAQYLLLYEMSLPFGLDLNNQLNVDKSASKMTVVFGHLKSRETREIAAAAKQWLHDHAPGLETEAVSPAVMFAHIADRNIKAMFAQMPLSLAAIVLLLLPTLRSWRFGLLCIVPLMFPVSIAFGIWGLIDGEINFTMAVVIGVVIGIIDDDTVHFMNEYLRGRRVYGLLPVDAIRHTFRTVGSALTVTTAVLVLGFLILAQSAFLPNSGMAQITAIAIAVALVFDLLLLPPLILLVDRAKEPVVYSVETHYEAVPVK